MQTFRIPQTRPCSQILRIAASAGETEDGEQRLWIEKCRLLTVARRLACVGELRLANHSARPGGPQPRPQQLYTYSSSALSTAPITCSATISRGTHKHDELEPSSAKK